jgi:hypothetical protein
VCISIRYLKSITQSLQVVTYNRVEYLFITIASRIACFNARYLAKSLILLKLKVRQFAMELNS